jgi:FKBP-type peptidyl-prolyl cis-trans isomerase 2
MLGFFNIQNLRRRMKYKADIILLGIALTLCFSVGTAIAGSEIEKESKKVITKGSKVSIEYTLFLEDGTTADTNVGRDPLVYEQGANMIIIGLELRLEGLKVDVPSEALKAGAMLQSRTEDGRVVPLKVHEVKEETVVLDFNHPLAGEKLTFDVKILDIQ